MAGKHMNRVSLLFLLVLGLLCLFISRSGSKMDQPVYLAFDEPVANSHDYDGTSLRSREGVSYLTQPSYVTVSHRGKALLTEFCRRTILLEKEDRIQTITILPHKQLLSFDDALRRVTSIADQLNVYDDDI